MRLGPPARRRARPSLIPLIDVMLVLLFFFMLASTYVGYGRTPLQLAAGGGGSQAAPPGQVRVLLLADGQLQIADQTLSAEQAIPALREAKDVRLTPATGVALQALLAVWEQLAAAGLPVQLAEGAR